MTPGRAALVQLLAQDCRHALADASLVEAGELPYGLELLATADWVLEHRPDLDDDDAVVEAVRAWSPREGRMFTSDHVTKDLGALRERGWSPELTSAR